MASCSICGAPHPSVHLTQIVHGVTNISDYCEKCFAMSENMPQVLKTVSQVPQSPQQKAESDANIIMAGLKKALQPQSELNTDIQRLKDSYKPKIKKISIEDGRFPVEAFEFVRESLHYALKRNAITPQSEHVTALELIEACQANAKETWGISAKAQLKSLNIETSSDVGEIVFLLINAGVLGKRPEDTREDFNDLPFLED